MELDLNTFLDLKTIRRPSLNTIRETSLTSIEPEPQEAAPLVTWQLLQVSDVLDQEFGSALAEDVPVLAWRPDMSYFPWLRRERDRFIDDPPLRVRSFPLLYGYWLFPLSTLAGLGRTQIQRMKSGCASPEKTPLICTTPYYAPVAEGWPGPVVYYLTDLMAAYDGAIASLVRSLDDRMCKAATLVCPNSARVSAYLAERAHCDPEKIVVIPNATRQSNLLAEPLYDAAELPPEVRGTPRPIAGVIGNLAGNMDWLFLRSLVETTPDFHWIFVGPVSMDIQDPAQRAARETIICYSKEHARVRFVGRKPYGELARYARSFDVAVLPYLRREPTFSGSSTRFYEHLAACRPMVATRGFEELLHKEPLLRLVDSADEAADALEHLRSVGFDDGHTVARWMASRQATWQVRAQAMRRALSQRWSDFSSHGEDEKSVRGIGREPRLRVSSS
jgi:glycosyltransferase involved in cell wall biosynthesis